MKKWIALLLAMVMLILVGCGAEKDDTQQQNTPKAPPTQVIDTTPTTAPDLQIVELTAWVVSPHAWQDAAAVDALLAEFNEYYPNILVTVEWKAEADLSAGKPDIVLADSAQIALWNDTGAMADLSELWKQGLWGDAYDVVADACRSDSGNHTVPMCVIPYCMAVNKGILTEAEAMQSVNTSNHTWNTASFLKVVQMVYDSGVPTVGTVFCKDTGEDVFTRLLMTNLYDANFVNHRSGYYQVDSEEMIKALRALRDQDGICFDATVDGAAAREQFLSGETAMVFNWSTALQLENLDNGNILFMAYPSGNIIPEHYGEVHGFGVFDNGDPVKVAASRTFVAHMSGNPAAIRATGNLPARKSARDVYEGTTLETVMKDLSKLLDYLAVEDTAAHWDAARNAWRDMLQSLNGEESVETYVRQCQNSINSLFPELAVETTAQEETE